MTRIAVTAAVAVTTALGAGLGGAAPAGAAAMPTPRQIARALARAEAAGTLWATINICHVARTGDLIGVRGQMPALGFQSTMSMTVALQAWSSSRRTFVTISSPNAVNHIALGRHATGLQQAGAEFPFQTGSTGQWRAAVTFTWGLAGRLLGRVTRTTTGGHPGADFSSPPHYSAASCQIS